MIEDDDRIDWNKNYPKLTREWYERIFAGADIRKSLRDAIDDERLVRVQSAILLVLFQYFPLSMTLDAIIDEINSQPFDKMADGAFNMYVEDIINSRMN